MAEILFLILGILCLGYFMGIVWYAGLSSRFPLLWMLLGMVFLALGGALHFEIFLPPFLCKILLLLTALFLCLFFFVEARIAKAMIQKAENNLDYLIVLGAQVKGARPSLSLAYRISEAEKYLKENPETKAVLSGGKGANEEISEAACMYQELVHRGIVPLRLIQENQSINTQQNIAFSYQLLEQDWKKAKQPCRVGIVTSNFHLYRGTAIAKKKTDLLIYGIAAKSSGFLQVNYLVREFFGVLKDWAAGNL